MGKYINWNMREILWVNAARRSEAGDPLMNWRHIPLIAFLLALVVAAARRLYAPEEDDHVY